MAAEVPLSSRVSSSATGAALMMVMSVVSFAAVLVHRVIDETGTDDVDELRSTE